MASLLTRNSDNTTVADALLRQIAVKVQLSPTDYGIAVDHYEAVDAWLSRQASPIAHLYAGLYPQGSMAVGATIASKLKNDEFDIDVIADLNIDPANAPNAILDALFNAMNGEEGSRYHGKVVRRSRCVTVEYDRMHLDITPAVRLPQFTERTSTIFHANETEPPAQHRHIVANPWGFAQWFKEKTPAVSEIVEAVLRKSADPVPDQEHALEKSVSLLSLQLLKRWRNKCYDGREGRSPPSIVLAFFVATNAGKSHDLFTELRIQSNAIHAEFTQANREGRLVAVHNPRCTTDVLTDRWPADLETQRVFLRDLDRLSAALDRVERDPSVEVCSEVFASLFGEATTLKVVEEFQERYAAAAQTGGLFTRGGSAGLALGASGLGAAPSAARSYSIPKHTDFGEH